MPDQPPVPTAQLGAASSAPTEVPDSPPCPFCNAMGAELVSPFGCQHLTNQWRCYACRSYFEAVRDDR
jgi:hypothetical protein